MVDVKDDNKKLLCADDILVAADLEPLVVYVPEWNGNVRIRPLTANQSMKLVQDKSNRNAAVVFVHTCLVDEDGKQLFTEKQAEALGKKSMKPLLRLQDIIMKMNGMREGDIDTMVSEAKND